MPNIADARTVRVEDASPRFPFGRNWKRFLSVLNHERIEAAEKSLRTMLGRESLDGCTFLDIGCGSGLFSLAAARLGASVVHSFDYDTESVECAKELRRRYAADSASWHVERGDVLDASYLKSLGQWDIVYSWGVLHHTGSMWKALSNAVERVGDGGRLYVALYNDQGLQSRIWTEIKKHYNRGLFRRGAIIIVGVPVFAVTGFVRDIARGRYPLERYHAGTRGMSAFHDWLDWLGGYPFEVATPDAVVRFCETRQLTLLTLTSVGRRLGCNEFLFQRSAGTR